MKMGKPTVITDNRLQSIDKLMELVDLENKFQLTKWGIQSRTPFEWMTYLSEETGEVSKAICESEYDNGDPQAVVAECIQVATLALKIAEMYNLRKG